MENQTPAQKRFVSYLVKRDPTLNENDIPSLLSSFTRFVKVVQKLYTEPQAQIIIKDKKVGDKVVHQKIIITDIEEIGKMLDKNKGKQSIKEVFQKFNEAVTKDKYGR